MSIPAIGQVGAFIEAAQGNVPAAVLTGTRTSAVVDRQAYGGNVNSCVLVAQTGATAGSPSAVSLSVQLQDCATSDGTPVNFGAALVVAAASTLAQKDIDLGPAKRYLFVKETAAITGGQVTTDKTNHAVAANVPLLASAAVRTSAAIDRQTFGTVVDYCTLVAQTGAATGAPDAVSLSVQLQHCATAGGVYVAFGDPLVIAAASTLAQQAVSLGTANRYLKVEETLGFTGGTSPKCPVCEHLIMIESTVTGGSLEAESSLVLGGAEKLAL